jgi:eukaryotic-like serine/threonine-protein kinase
MNCPGCQNPAADDAIFCGICGASLQSASGETVTVARKSESGSPNTDQFIGKILDSKYEILELLGQGGMGAVYRARRRHIGDDVAIKLLLERFLAGDESTERFRREARAAAMLRHPNVVAIHDFSEGHNSDTPPYIVMELVEGTSLRQLLMEAGKLSPDRAVSLFRGICAGVGTAHRRGLIHRDLKPENIIIAAPERAGDDETVKVIDFGIVKLRESEMGTTLTQAGTLIGTPSYMSPEQCLGEPLDARSDVYSLGAILYEMLSGHPPFTASAPTAVIAKHLTDTPTSLVQLGVDSALAEVCQRALEKPPETRYQTVDAFFSDLSRSVDKSTSNTLRQVSVPTQPTQAAAVTAIQPDVSLSDRALAQGSAATAPTIVHTGSSDQSVVKAETSVGKLLAKQFRRASWFGIATGLSISLFSVGVGFLLRWLGWAQFLAYDEFVVLLITIAVRDGVFGALLGVALSGIFRRQRGALLNRSEWPVALVRYAAAGAAVAMFPFVILRTSLILLPLGLATLGATIGLAICGTRLAVLKFSSRN